MISPFITNDTFPALLSPLPPTPPPTTSDAGGVLENQVIDRLIRAGNSNTTLGKNNVNRRIHSDAHYTLAVPNSEWDSRANKLFPVASADTTSTLDIDNLAQTVRHLSKITGVPVPDFVKSYQERKSKFAPVARRKMLIEETSAPKRVAPTENTTSEHKRFSDN